MLAIDLGEEGLYQYLSTQLKTFFPDGVSFDGADTRQAFKITLERVERCFAHISLSGFSDENGHTYLSHTHTDQYAMFLYFFMNSLWKVSDNKAICNKVMALNRALHGFFVSYKCALPSIFCIQHPVGTVLGNACYSDYLVVLQNVTVNTGVSEDGTLVPKLGKGLYLGAGSKIIGNESVGDRCSVGVNAIVYNQKIEDDFNVISQKRGGSAMIKRKKEHCKAQLFFRDAIK